MELRQLRYFMKIADLGSMSKAARVLHVAQPALSQQMSQLEAELAQPLLTRLSFGVRLTEHGAVFYTHAQRILRQIDDIPAAVSSLEKNLSGSVSIGLPQSTAAQFALPLFRFAVQRFPAIKLEFFDEISGHILQRLSGGRFDLGVIVSDQDAALLCAIPLMDEHLFLVSRTDQAPALDSVTAHDIARLPLSVPGPGQGIRSALETYLMHHGARMPEPLILANSMNIMRRSMLDGLAHTVMPWGAVSEDIAAGTLKATPIVPLFSRRVYVCSACGATLSLAAQAIQTALIEIVRKRVLHGEWQGVTLL